MAEGSTHYLTKPEDFEIKVAEKITITVTFEYPKGEKVSEDFEVRPESFTLSRYKPIVETEDGKMAQARGFSFVMHGMTLKD